MATTDGVRHRTVHVNGINMHVAERGDENSPVILFIHGFPELWYSWRHQIGALSDLGYRAVAPDMRGYGDTEAPSDFRCYTYAHIVGDLVALLDELGVEKVFVVGHDWGAIIAWWLCLFRPDRVKALVNMSVAFVPRNPKSSLLDMVRAAYGDDYYMCRFQVAGEMENEIAEAGGADKFLKLCFSNRNPGPLFLPKGVAFKDDYSYPEWLSKEEATYFCHKFTKTGFTGGLNYYRALNLSSVTEKMATASDGINRWTLHTNGINMHVAEKGDKGAPIVLFLHGFPELWYTWKHQILALSSLGYRAVAPDMRGFGDTDAPRDASRYTYGHIVGDIVGLINALGAHQVFVVGHDWGAVIAWWLCLFRPDRVKAVVNLSVAFMPRDPKATLLDMVRAAYGDDYYMIRFQEPGEMESEIAEAGGADIFLRKLFSYRDPGPLYLPKGEAFKDVPPYPKYLSKDDIAYYRDKFTQTGFTGGFNYYRAINLNWEITAPWTGAQVKVPVKFVVGDLDLSYNLPGVKEYVNGGGMKKDVPLLEDVVILKGVAHFLQAEKPEVITNQIYDFIRKF